MNQLDSPQISYVQSIAYSYGSPAFLRAQALLALNNVTPYQVYIPNGKGTKSLKQPVNKWKMMRTVAKQCINVSPNPAGHITTITTQITDATAPSTLRVSDVLGNIILSKPLVTNYDVTLMPVDGLPSGVYICAVEQNGRTTMNSKIIVAHQ